MKTILFSLLLFVIIACNGQTPIMTAAEARKLSSKQAPTIIDIMTQVRGACMTRDTTDAGLKKITYTDRISQNVEDYLRDSLGYTIVIGNQRRNNKISW